MATNGLASLFGLKKRGDRWNVYEVEYIELPPPPHWKKKEEHEEDIFWKTAALFEEVHSLTDYRDTSAAAGMRARGQQKQRREGSFLTQQQQQPFDDHGDIDTIDEEGEGCDWEQQGGLQSTTDDDVGMDAAAHRLDYGSISISYENRNSSFMQEDNLDADAAVIDAHKETLLPQTRVADRDGDGDGDAAETAAVASDRTISTRPPIIPQPPVGAVAATAAAKTKPVKGPDSSSAESSKEGSSDSSNRSSVTDSSRKTKQQQPHSINWFIRQYTSSTPTYESALARSSRSGGIGRSKAGKNTAAAVGIALSDTYDRSFSSGDSLPSLPSISIRKEAGQSSVSEKGAGQSSASEKGAGQSSASEKGAGQSSANEKGIGQGSASEKGTGQSSVSEKGTGQSLASEKGTGQGSASESHPVNEQDAGQFNPMVVSGSKVPEQIMFGSKVSEHDLDEESTSHLSISSNGSSFVSFNNSNSTNSSALSDAQAEEKARYAEIVRYFDREENKR